jgi:hypothetical protein
MGESMSISLQQLQAEDAAWSKQYDEQQASKKQPKQKPKPSDVFMMDVPSGHVPDELIHAAIHAADTMYPYGNGTTGKGWNVRYSMVRDAVVTFHSESEPSAENDAVARLCIPLLGYARVLAHLHAVAYHAQTLADRGMKPDTVRFADVHSLGERTGAVFVAALQLAHHELPHVYINFIGGTVSESHLDAQIRKDVSNPAAAKLLTLAASVLKDGVRATHTAISSGATTTKDLIPESRQSILERERQMWEEKPTPAASTAPGTPGQAEEGEA